MPGFEEILFSGEGLNFESWDKINAVFVTMKEQGVVVPPLSRHDDELTGPETQVRLSMYVIRTSALTLAMAAVAAAVSFGNRGRASWYPTSRSPAATSSSVSARI